MLLSRTSLLEHLFDTSVAKLPLHLAGMKQWLNSKQQLHYQQQVFPLETCHEQSKKKDREGKPCQKYLNTALHHKQQGFFIYFPQNLFPLIFDSCRLM